MEVRKAYTMFSSTGLLALGHAHTHTPLLPSNLQATPPTLSCMHTQEEQQRFLLPNVHHIILCFCLVGRQGWAAILGCIRVFTNCLSVTTSQCIQHCLTH